MPKKANHDAQLRALAGLALQPMPSHAPTALNPAPRIPLGRASTIGPAVHSLAEFAAMPPEQRKRVALRESLNTFNAPDVGTLGESLMTTGQIKAFHGSPHSFDKFSLSKIGTGEGAQVYGHGLYFAENEGVARSYRDALKGKQYHPEWMRLYTRELELESELARIDDQIGRESLSLGAKGAEGWGNLGARHPEAERKWLPVRERVEAELAEIQKTKASVPEIVDHPGAMYEVGINAEPDEFLHWDKPLSEQSPKVRAALEEADVPMRDRWKQSGAWEHVKGQQLYEQLAEGAAGNGGMMPQWARNQNAAPAAAEALRAKGIKGIRYLDQGSRWTPRAPYQYEGRWLIDHPQHGTQGFPTREAAESKLADWKAEHGQGTHNVVVFDDSIIDILKKYGLAGLMAGGAAHASREP